MKFRIKWQMFPMRVNSLLSWSRSFFLVIGILALGYVGLVAVDAKLHQIYLTWQFEQALKELRPESRTGERPHPSPLPPVFAEVPTIAAGAGDPLGRIEIRTIGLVAMMMEGIDEGTLRHAVGHIPGTPLPGQQGNVALAGHRDTFFRGLRKIRVDDEITLTTLSGSYRYRVDSTNVVSPEEIEVLDSDDDHILTLVTCFPFNFVGSAPMRFIVRAHRVSE